MPTACGKVIFAFLGCNGDFVDDFGVHGFSLFGGKFLEPMRLHELFQNGKNGFALLAGERVEKLFVVLIGKRGQQPEPAACLPR